MKRTGQYTEASEWDGGESGFPAAWVIPTAGSQDAYVGGGALTEAAGGAVTLAMTASIICKRHNLIH